MLLSYKVNQDGYIGVFNRIVIHPEKWDILPVPVEKYEQAAIWGVVNSGLSYDWRLILGFIAWPINLFRQRDSFATCSKAVAMALGIGEAWRQDPCILHETVRFKND